VVVWLVVAAAAAGAYGDALPSTLRLVDQSRSVRLPDGRSAPRTLTTVLRYPSGGSGPWPLIVFGHGFASTPQVYGRLLDAWAKAGYLVAAPVFPLGNADAPGGPDRSDLPNQPRDMSFVITQLLAASASPASPLYGLVDPARIAVAGHSDGAMTAFAAAYERGFRDRRIAAAIILSGARLGGAETRFPHSPPLLAVQGTDDDVNSPANANVLYGAVARPKFVLWLRHAGHGPPYTIPSRALATVERATIAFLDHYLLDAPLSDLRRAATSYGIGVLTAAP
jgi:fermentation-respiration switch protein FrsA (DUF1100 family)